MQRFVDTSGFLLWLLVTACGGGGGDNSFGAGAGDLDGVAPYTLFCAETACDHARQSCESAREERCDSCYDSCVHASDPAGCASVCRSVCSDDCSCSASDTACAKQGVRFQPPRLNDELYRENLLLQKQCSPDQEPSEAAAEFVARSFGVQALDLMRCVRAHACDLEPCVEGISPGTLGDVICARQRACGASCDPILDDATTAASVNRIEPYLRPGLIAELKRCVNETDCNIATACWDALKPAVDLGDYPTP